MRRSTKLVAAVAVVAVAYTFSHTGAQPPAKDQGPSPKVVMAGVVDQVKVDKDNGGSGYKVKSIYQGKESRIGFEIVFDKELPQEPVVIVSGIGAENMVSVWDASKSGFRVLGKWEFQGVWMPGARSFSFLVVLP